MRQGFAATVSEDLRRTFGIFGDEANGLRLARATHRGEARPRLPPLLLLRLVRNVVRTLLRPTVGRTRPHGQSMLAAVCETPSGPLTLAMPGALRSAGSALAAGVVDEPADLGRLAADRRPVEDANGGLHRAL